jgi:NTP pyrophosphatase (non-canonical NTP hydrolase)
MESGEMVRLIREKIPMTELMAGLAEEASELAQAALKLRRCYDGTNPTPADPDAQYERFLEEIGDTELYIDQLSVNRQVIDDYKSMKQERWQRRLEGL